MILAKKLMTSVVGTISGNPTVFQVNTTLLGDSSNDQFSLGVIDSDTLIIDWGDDSDFEELAIGTATHTYAASGVYNIKLTGTGSIRIDDVGDMDKLVDWTHWGDVVWLNLDEMFRGAECTFTYTDIPDLTLTTSMSRFAMSSTFNKDISGWDFSSVSNMSNMFSNSDFNNGGQSLYMSLPQVINMEGMFSGCVSFNQPIDINAPINPNFLALLHSCITFNSSIDITTNNGEDFQSMFEGCTAFNQSVGSLDTSSATDMQWMFADCDNFNKSLSHFQTGNVYSMGYMFYNAGAFNQNLTGWDVDGNVTSCGSFDTGSGLDTGNRPNFDSCTI